MQHSCQYLKRGLRGISTRILTWNSQKRNKIFRNQKFQIKTKNIAHTWISFFVRYTNKNQKTSCAVKCQMVVSFKKWNDRLEVSESSSIKVLKISSTIITDLVLSGILFGCMTQYRKRLERFSRHSTCKGISQCESNARRPLKLTTTFTCSQHDKPEFSRIFVHCLQAKQHLDV